DVYRVVAGPGVQSRRPVRGPTRERVEDVERIVAAPAADDHRGCTRPAEADRGGGEAADRPVVSTAVEADDVGHGGGGVVDRDRGQALVVVDGDVSEDLADGAVMTEVDDVGPALPQDADVRPRPLDGHNVRARPGVQPGEERVGE